jgi:hypothetical protein
MGGYTRAVSGQRLGKHVLAATDTNPIIGDCFLCGPCRYVYSKGRGCSSVSSVQESVRRGLESGGRSIAIVTAVTRKRLGTD